MAAKKSLEANHIDIIVLDFFGLGIYESGDFIDAVRRKWPEVVIVMHADAEMFELNASYFDGARSRLPHYYRLSRDLDGEALAAQADEVLGHCLMDLGRSVAPENACDAAGSGGQA
jgi:hypothetical protein